MGKAEADLQADILDYLNTVGFFRKVHTVGIPNGRGSRRKNASAGMSDIIGLLKGGRFMAVEVKKPGKGKPKPEAKQAAYLAGVNDAGGIGICVNTLDAVRRAVLEAQ